MILLDNAVYVTNACHLLERAPGYRTIPLAISCYTGGDFATTSLINLAMIFLTLYLLFRAFDGSRHTSLIAGILFGLNAYVAFPFYYAAAHSYVYTILASVLSLYVINHCHKLSLKNFFSIILCALFLKFVRSEGPLYFVIALIAFAIHKYLSSQDLKDFWHKNKTHITAAGVIIALTLVFNFLFPLFLSPGERIAKNLQENKYVYQFPKETFNAVALWATYDYLRAFLTPYYQNFFGDYNDWYVIHKNKSYQILLYLFSLAIAIFSTVLILKRRKNLLSYLVIALSIFIIPSFLISSFLRNQWFYPSRGLLGCYLALPFLVMAYQSLSKHKLRSFIIGALFLINISTFLIHHLSHYKNEQTMFHYEHKFLGLEHPTVSKLYAMQFFKQKDFKRSTLILRDAQRALPDEGIFLSANHFYLWAENHYWSAASSYFYGSPITEEKILKSLYQHPNFFAALACLQDQRIELDNCLRPELLRHLCNPAYVKRFGYKYYKKTRIKGEMACAKR
ncbi:MAG: hypothetical protein CME62_15450 [Halobacteriovoraceae bacterium]|nr:hypothetical protein [Halobacteriovoraceae bacterium]|tara:strand:+ start:8013 stop:9536 length:1524 start_codon:yes stop_codon:yes gene_type:complete